ncbi:TrlF family AAA-like ATPase [Gracilimonas sp.]|uniref:TrlF family AAA-like ATPase n=1 Tax=Gracilimonas sp. TaxID=1974203 RepID=UPI003D0E368A
MNDPRGSVWRKWDLHVHTPASIVHHFGNQEDVWGKFLKDLESLPSEFKVLGINDYMFLDGYERLLREKRENNRLQNIDLLLPVIEFRIEKFAGVDFGSFKRMNLHVIFSEEVLVENIKSQFLNTLDQSYVLNDGQEWNRAITKESISDLGRSIKENIPPEELENYGSDLIEGFNNLNVKEEQIFKALKRDCFIGKSLIAIGKTEWDSLRWSDASIATKKSIINKADIVFTAAENIDAFENAQEKLTEQGVNNKLLDCSDAHHFSDSGEKDRIGNCFTWIKADPTFEGLKQILFEYSYRVHIGENSPPPPPKSIDKLSLSIPQKLYVNKETESERESFCINGDLEVYFSPNLNCLIGGRGTGKSTILNLIQLKINDGSNKLYDKSEIIDENGKVFNLKEAIDITGTSSENIEFLNQNEIEQFALNTQEFTKVVYDRLQQIGDRDELKEKRLELIRFLEIVENGIDRQKKIIKLKEEKERKERILKDKKKEISILEDDEYERLQNDINNHSKELTTLRNSRKRLGNFLEEISEIIQKYASDTEEDTNLFDDILIEIRTSLQDSIALNSETVKSKSDREEELEIELEKSKKELGEYLSNLGYESENISNISSAQSEANELEADIEKAGNEIKVLRKRNDSINMEDRKRDEFENLITPRIEELNGRLKGISEATQEVEEIALKHEFNVERAFEDLCEKFNKSELPTFDSGTSLSDKDVKSLFKNFFNEAFELKPDEEIISVLEEERNNLKTYKVIFEFFSSNMTEHLKLFRIYHLLYKSDIEEYLKIKVTYDGRDIRSSSFGQRCTAAMVILLSMGNNPIIIDEPEAHLDSGLIAKYLVTLIKERKQHRQIIFATHNANFVINGDSELIHVLSMNDENLTEIVPTTIENMDHRESLYNLEGGKEAFIQREKKYSF